MKDFEVEIEGKKQKLVFKDPNQGDCLTWSRFGVAQSKEVKEIRKTEGDDSPKIVDKLEQLLEEKNKMLVNLCNTKDLEKTSDVSKISNPDLRKIYKWLDECLALVESEKDKNFTKA